MEQDGEWRTEGTDGAEGGEISRELMSRRASESSKDDAPVPPPAYSEAEQEEDKLVAATYDLLRVSCMKDQEKLDRVISKLFMFNLRNGRAPLAIRTPEAIRTPVEERLTLSDAREAWNEVFLDVGRMVALGCPSAFKALFQECMEDWPALGVSTSWQAVMPEAAIDLYQHGRDFEYAYEIDEDGVEYVADTIYDVVKRGFELSSRARYPEGLRLQKGGHLTHAEYLLRQFGPEFAVLYATVQPRITREMCARNFDTSQEFRDNISKLGQAISQECIPELVQELRGDRLADGSF